MNKVQHVKWCMKQTKLTSEISCPTDFCLAQLVEHKSDDQEVMSSNLLGTIFDEFFFGLPCVEICQIISQKRVSWKIRMMPYLSINSYQQLDISQGYRWFITDVETELLQHTCRIRSCACERNALGSIPPNTSELKSTSFLRGSTNSQQWW